MTYANSKQAAGNSGAKRRLKLWAIVITLFMGWAGYTLVNQAKQQEETAMRLAAIRNQLAETHKENNGLRKQMERLNDPEYIEQLARKEQGMVKKGEIQIQVVE
jgi:cell division protein DivIC